jgi:hypothetical protein
MYTYIKPTYAESTAFFVETWYSRQTRSYVTQLKDLNLDQIGDAVYTGNKTSALRAHQQTVDSLTDGTAFLTHNFSGTLRFKGVA